MYNFSFTAEELATIAVAVTHEAMNSNNEKMKERARRVQTMILNSRYGLPCKRVLPLSRGEILTEQLKKGIPSFIAEELIDEAESQIANYLTGVRTYNSIAEIMREYLGLPVEDSITLIMDIEGV